MRMQHGGVPTFQQTLRSVDPLSDLIFEVMDQATAKTRAFFASEKQIHDPFLAPCLMRFFAKQALRGRGIKAEEDGDSSDFEALPNNGLAFFYKRHHVRILKAAIVRGVQWKLPGCGASEPKTEFYNQQLEMYPDGRGNIVTSVLNIIYLWDFDASLSLAGVYLACPMSAGANAKDVTDHWCEPLLHPALRKPHEHSGLTEGDPEEDLEALLGQDELEDAESVRQA